MSAHTPGPWHFVPTGSTGRGRDDAADKGGFYGPDGEEVCWFGDETTYYPCEGSPPNEVDARLIAAAPCLLAALLGVLRVADRQTDEFDAARAAIAKATTPAPAVRLEEG